MRRKKGVPSAASSEKGNQWSAIWTSKEKKKGVRVLLRSRGGHALTVESRGKKEADPIDMKRGRGRTLDLVIKGNRKDERIPRIFVGGKKTQPGSDSS